ncbi:ImmA/IrrE family metallo-endopeptidase [Salinimonas chungwhensis]|uniref:ImmA/IrrE family metallo-endopeptidase n=1 Tax=Salinimonas chungwhensis TaxID=265425 RepID=UPI00037B3468|nr:ImmA/IrrE family metallo-endopeptidase [Salinimonas chungwhensis]
MSDNLGFSPEWASPPGETIRTILYERDVEIDEFSSLVGIEREFCERMLLGYESITQDLAKSIEEVTEVSAKFWINRESRYRKQLDASHDERIQWLARLPLKDMTKWNWIPKGLRVWEKFEACLDFFNIRSLEEWDDKFSSRLSKVAFRTSNSFDNSPESVITWLYQAEKIAKQQNIASWNSDKLSSSLPEIRKLTLIDNPKEFVPRLRSLFASCGVNLVLLPTPKGTRASGATFFSKENEPILVLSFRYKTNDHFWFSLFHEIGHLLLHSSSSIFIEGKDIANSEEEREADVFSQEALIPLIYRDEMLNFTHKDWIKIIRFSKKIGIARGIVVGQLQHCGNIDHKYLNKLKVRYDTNGLFD